MCVPSSVFRFVPAAVAVIDPLECHDVPGRVVYLDARTVGACASLPVIGVGVDEPCRPNRVAKPRSNPREHWAVSISGVSRSATLVWLHALDAQNENPRPRLRRRHGHRVALLLKQNRTTDCASDSFVKPRVDSRVDTRRKRLSPQQEPRHCCDGAPAGQALSRVT